MPLPNYVTFTQASCHDSTPFKQILSHFNYCSIFGDKAYFGKEMTQILNKQHCQLLHPIKKIKGEGQLNTYIKHIKIYGAKQYQLLDSLLSVCLIGLLIKLTFKMLLKLDLPKDYLYMLMGKLLRLVF